MLQFWPEYLKEQKGCLLQWEGFRRGWRAVPRTRHVNIAHGHPGAESAVGAAEAGRGALCGDSPKCVGGRGPTEVSLGHPHIHRWVSSCLQHRHLRRRQEKAALGRWEEAFNNFSAGTFSSSHRAPPVLPPQVCPTHTQVPVPHSFPSGTAGGLLFPPPPPPFSLSGILGFWLPPEVCTQDKQQKTGLVLGTPFQLCFWILRQVAAVVVLDFIYF